MTCFSANNEIFNLPNVFIIANDILIVDYDTDGIDPTKPKVSNANRVVRNLESKLKQMLFQVHNFGDVMAEWIACGALNMHFADLNLSAASWLTM